MKNSDIYIPWDGWRMVRPIGYGSFGRVYEIERRNGNNIEKAAMKVISVSVDMMDDLYGSQYDDKSMRDMCLKKVQGICREYVIMRELRGNPNIVRCDDIKEIEHQDGIGYDVYIMMELLIPLQQIWRSREITEDDAFRLGEDICRALMVCEEHNIIHRDIKPQNILVSENGTYKLGDFGTARTFEHTASATMAGTETYMAPEIIRREKYGRDVDTYSLGLVMYRMLNRGQLPFIETEGIATAADRNRSLQRRLSGEALPPPADGSDMLKAIVLKACAYDRADRYRSASEMLDDLMEITEQTMALFEQEQSYAEDLTGVREFIQSYGTHNTVENLSKPAEDDAELTVVNEPAAEHNNITAGATGNVLDVLKSWNGVLSKLCIVLFAATAAVSVVLSVRDIINGEVYIDISKQLMFLPAVMTGYGIIRKSRNIMFAGISVFAAKLIILDIGLFVYGPEEIIVYLILLISAGFVLWMIDPDTKKHVIVPVLAVALNFATYCVACGELVFMDEMVAVYALFLSGESLLAIVLALDENKIYSVSRITADSNRRNRERITTGIILAAYGIIAVIISYMCASEYDTELAGTSFLPAAFCIISAIGIFMENRKVLIAGLGVEVISGIYMVIFTTRVLLETGIKYGTVFLIGIIISALSVPAMLILIGLMTGKIPYRLQAFRLPVIAVLSCVSVFTSFMLDNNLSSLFGSFAIKSTTAWLGLFPLLYIGMILLVDYIFSRYADGNSRSNDSGKELLADQ